MKKIWCSIAILMIVGIIGGCTKETYLPEGSGTQTGGFVEGLTDQDEILDEEEYSNDEESDLLELSDVISPKIIGASKDSVYALLGSSPDTRGNTDVFRGINLSPIINGAQDTEIDITYDTYSKVRSSSVHVWAPLSSLDSICTRYAEYYECDFSGTTGRYPGRSDYDTKTKKFNGVYAALKFLNKHRYADNGEKGTISLSRGGDFRRMVPGLGLVVKQRSVGGEKLTSDELVKIWIWMDS